MVPPNYITIFSNTYTTYLYRKLVQFDSRNNLSSKCSSLQCTGYKARGDICLNIYIIVVLSVWVSETPCQKYSTIFPKNIPQKIFQHLRGIPGIFIEGTPHVWVKFWHGTPHQLCVSNSKLANFGDPHEQFTLLGPVWHP